MKGDKKYIPHLLWKKTNLCDKKSYKEYKELQCGGE
jgi:hypothetical protein